MPMLLNIVVDYFASVPQQWHDFITHPAEFLPIIGMLIIIESLLSVDNAAVLATMVMDLPKEERKRALKYGIFGAYFFRGLCLILAGFLITVWWLKPIGGLYLLFLVLDWWKSKRTHKTEDDLLDKKSNWFYKITVGAIGNFWATVALVELMDLAFSIDNVFAAVAYTPNIIAIWIGVFIGILAMRFVAQAFVSLMEKYAFLETCAFLVITVLGLKLLFSVFEHFYPESAMSKFMTSHLADWLTSGITLAIFVVPIITSLVFNFPKHHASKK